MDNLKFRASANPIKATFDLIRNQFALYEQFIRGQRKSGVLTLYWIIIAAIFLIGIIHSLYVLLVIIVLTVLVSTLFLLVYLRIKKSSPIFNVRAVYFSSDKGFEIEYKDSTRRFVEYNNIVGLILKSEFDKAHFFSILHPVFWPKAAEYMVTSHFLLVVKEGESQKEIPIPLDIPRVQEAINLIKRNYQVTVNIEGAKMLLFAYRPFSRKEILIVLLIIFGFAILVFLLGF